METLPHRPDRGEPSRATVLTTVLESVPDAMLAVDAAGRLTKVNLAARELLSLPGDALPVGRPLREVMASSASEPATRLCELLLEALRTGQPLDADLTVPAADGSGERTLSVRAGRCSPAAPGAERSLWPSTSRP